MIHPTQASIFYSKTYTNSDGSPRKYKRNGRVKTWKRDPGKFKIPVKRGLNEYGYITNDNIDQFTWE